VEALHPQRRFAAIAANLLWSELAPVLPAIAELLVPEGRAVFSGLLESQAPELVAAAAPHGLREERRLRRVDASDVAWVALLMIREPAPPRR
jgi:ribosomal protein L11 methylase PrmA